jgi:hypothetical protein
MIGKPPSFFLSGNLRTPSKSLSGLLTLRMDYDPHLPLRYDARIWSRCDRLLIRG